MPSLAASSPKPKAEAVEAKGAKMVRLEEIGLPHYTPAPSFREDLVINREGKAMTMKRFVDHAKIRTELSAEGHDIVMLETGDSKGTMYTLMAEDKKAIKQSRQAAAEATANVRKQEEGDAKEATEASAPDIQAQDLGVEKVDGLTARKVRMVYGKEGDVLGWFDKETGAPLRMESVVDGEKTSIEWKNRKAEPQPAELFEVPKGYDVMDMDQMMKQMGGKGAMGGMGAMGAMGGMGAMAKGMAGGMVQGMGSNLGGSLGATLGGSLGGPIGAMAGQFLGGKIGGMLGKKAANAVK